MERIFGRHCINAALSATRRELFKLSVFLPAQKRPTTEQLELIGLIERARNLKIPVEMVSKTQLDTWSGQRPHQNAVLTAGPLHLEGCSKWIDTEWTGFALLLDGLKDPQNIGALLRSAFFLGAQGIIIRNTAITGMTVSKASTGVLEAWDQIYQLDCSLEALQKSSFIAAASLSSSLKIPEVTLESFPRQERTILVMGSEHNGVSKQLLAHSHATVKIPSQRESLFVDSLNVSAAGAILMHKLSRRGSDPFA